MTDTTPGWQPDPTSRHEHRYWDGSQWTDNVADAGVASTDAYEVPDAAAEAPGWADPTTTMPAASSDPTAPPTDPTATWPAASSDPTAPPSYAPPAPPLGGPGESAGSGSKRGLLIGGGVLVIVAIVVGFLLMSGDDDGNNDALQTRLASDLRSTEGLNREDADCMAGELIDELGADTLDGIDFAADEPPEDLDIDAMTRAYDNALEACDADEQASTDGDDDDTTTSTLGDDDFDIDDFDPDDFDPDDVDVDDFDMEETLTDLYADMFNLSQDQAECLARSMADAMDSGSLEDGSMDDMSAMFDLFADCDISLSEIGAN